MSSKRTRKKQNKQISANSSRVTPYARSNNGRYGLNPDANTKRDLWEVGGIPEYLNFDILYNTFRRSGLAKAGVMKPVERCWKTLPKITDGEFDENNNREKTDFEKDLEYLIEEHDIFNRFIGLDYRQRVGRYGGIVIVAKEDSSTNPSSKKELKGLGVKSIVKLMPVFESQIKVVDDIDDITSPDFGNPRSYNFQSNATGSRNTSGVSLDLHPSRVFAFGEGADDGTIYGKSCLEPSINALWDWEKIRISAAEGYYKNSKQRFAMSIKDTETAGSFLNTENKAIFDKNVDDFGKGWDSTLLLSGMDVVAMQSSITDPTGPANMCMQEIVSGFNIPKTILIGFETGERSSTENSQVFDEDMMSRRENTLSQMIRNFLYHLINQGLMSPPSEKICVEWDDLLASSDNEKLDNATKMATINQTSYNAGSGHVFTEEEIREAAGFTNEDINSDEFSEVDLDELGVVDDRPTQQTNS